MVPRQISETFRPVRPMRRCFMRPSSTKGAPEGNAAFACGTPFALLSTDGGARMKEKSKVRKAMERDAEQTKHDLTRGKKGRDIGQDVDDTVKQAAGKKRIPPKNVKNPEGR